MAQPSRNGGKILSGIAATLFALGGIYYGILLWDSFRMMQYTIHESAEGMVLVTEGITGRALPYLVALCLLIVFAAVQILALIRPSFSWMAATSAAVPLLFPLFTDVALAEFTRVGWVYPASLIKYIPFGIAALVWLVQGIVFSENMAGSGTKSA